MNSKKFKAMSKYSPNKKINNFKYMKERQFKKEKIKIFNKALVSNKEVKMILSRQAKKRKIGISNRTRASNNKVKMILSIKKRKIKISNRTLISNKKVTLGKKKYLKIITSKVMGHNKIINFQN